MKARLLQFAMLLMIGVALAGCAGTGVKHDFTSYDPYAPQGSFPAQGTGN